MKIGDRNNLSTRHKNRLPEGEVDLKPRYILPSVLLEKKKLELSLILEENHQHNHVPSPNEKQCAAHHTITS